MEHAIEERFCFCFECCFYECLDRVDISLMDSLEFSFDWCDCVLIEVLRVECSDCCQDVSDLRIWSEIWDKCVDRGDDSLYSLVFFLRDSYLEI